MVKLLHSKILFLSLYPLHFYKEFKFLWPENEICILKIPFSIDRPWRLFSKWEGWSVTGTYKGFLSNQCAKIHQSTWSTLLSREFVLGHWHTWLVVSQRPASALNQWLSNLDTGIPWGAWKNTSESPQAFWFNCSKAYTPSSLTDSNWQPSLRTSDPDRPD